MENQWAKKGKCSNYLCVFLHKPQSSPAPKIVMLRSQTRLWGRLVYFLSAIFISLFTCCSVSIYPWWGLLLGRNDHFQQQSLRIRATSHIVPVTTNDYQCIWASCQCAGGGAGDGGGGGCTLQGERFSSHVAALKPHITPPQSTKSLICHVPRDWISLLWEAGSDTACLEASWDRSQRAMRGHLIHPTAKPSFPLFHPSAHLHYQGQRGRQNFTLHVYYLAL